MRIKKEFVHVVIFKQKIKSLIERIKLNGRGNEFKEAFIPATSLSDVEKSVVDEYVALIVCAQQRSKRNAIEAALCKAIKQVHQVFFFKDVNKRGDHYELNASNQLLQSFSEKYVNVLDNGDVFVILKVVINVHYSITLSNISNLSPSLNSTFALDIKEKELNILNEQTILNSLLLQIRKAIFQSFDLELETKELKKISYKYFGEFLTKNYMSNDPNSIYNRGYNKFLKKYKIKISDIESSYMAQMTVSYIPNSKTYEIAKMIADVCRCTCLSTEDERCAYKNFNQKLGCLSLDCIENEDLRYYYFRSPCSLLNKWKEHLLHIFFNELSNFKIIDNLGAESSFRTEMIFDTNLLDNICNNIDECKYSYSKGKSVFKIAVFQPALKEWESGDNIDLTYLTCKEKAFRLNIYFLIHKSDIYKYSTFRIEHKYTNGQ